MTADNLLHQVQQLSDQLADSLDLESALDAGLKYLLELLNRERGALLINSLSGAGSSLIAARQLSRQWASQLNDQSSQLHQIASSLAENNGQVVSDPSISLGAAYPLRSGENTLGALLLEGKEASAEELEILKELSRVLSRRIRQDHIERKNRQPNQELAAILMTSTMGHKGMDPNQLQARLMRSVYRFFQVDHGALVLLDESEPDLAIIKTLRVDSEWDYEVYLKDQPSLIGTCIEGGEMLVENDLAHNPLFNPTVDVIQEGETRNILCCPLVIDDQVKGALVLCNKLEGSFDSYDRTLAFTISKLISYTIYDLDLVQRLRIASAELEVSRWQLLQSRNTLRALFDNIPLSMYIVDSRYTLLAINLSRADRAGILPSDLVGKKCYQALYKRSDPCPSCQVDRTLFGGENTYRGWKEYLEDHHPVEWEISSYPISGDSGDVRQAILIEEEVTERKFLENQLIQSEKLAVVGQLAAGIAHEINNPLTAIVANTQLLQRQGIEDEEIQEALQLIEIAGDRAAKVIGNLLNLARKDQYEFKATDINSLISESLELLDHEIKANLIKVKFHPGEDLPRLQLSWEQIIGVWTNLIINGIDAQKDQESGLIEIKTFADEEYVYATFRDQGQGIPSEQLQRIFEPFFTTKDTGEGTGLGLTICQKVIKQHGGRLSVDSAEGQGTKFTVQLPYTD